MHGFASDWLTKQRRDDNGNATLINEMKINMDDHYERQKRVPLRQRRESGSISSINVQKCISSTTKVEYLAHSSWCHHEDIDTWIAKWSLVPWPHGSAYLSLPPQWFPAACPCSSGTQTLQWHDVLDILKCWCISACTIPQNTAYILDTIISNTKLQKRPYRVQSFTFCGILGAGWNCVRLCVLCKHTRCDVSGRCHHRNIEYQENPYKSACTKTTSSLMASYSPWCNMSAQIDVSSQRDRASPIQHAGRSSRPSSVRTLGVGEEIEINRRKNVPPQDEAFSFNFFDRNPAVRTARRTYLVELAKGVLLISIVMLSLFSIYWGSLWKLPTGSLDGWIVVRHTHRLSVFQPLTEGRTSTVALLAHSSHNRLWLNVSHLYIGTSFPQWTFRAEFHKLRMPWWRKRHGLP